MECCIVLLWGLQLLLHFPSVLSRLPVSPKSRDRYLISFYLIAAVVILITERSELFSLIAMGSQTRCISATAKLSAHCGYITTSNYVGIMFLEVDNIFYFWIFMRHDKHALHVACFQQGEGTSSTACTFTTMGIARPWRSRRNHQHRRRATCQKVNVPVRCPLHRAHTQQHTKIWNV